MSINRVSIKVGRKKLRSFQFSIEQDVCDHHDFYIECDAHILGDFDGVINPDDIYSWIGKDAVIKVSNSSVKNDELSFKGIINHIELGKSRSNYDRVTLYGKSDTLLLDDGQDVKSFTEKSISDIAKEVLSPFSKKLKINISNDVTIPYCTQYRETPFDFISRLAFRYGLWFYYDGQDLRLGDYEATNEYKLKLGTTTNEYSMELIMLPCNYGYQEYQYKKDEKFEVLSSDLTGPSMDNYGQAAMDASLGMFTPEHKSNFTELFETEKDIKDFATHRLNSRAAQMMSLNGDSKNPSLHIGTKINVKDKKNKNVGSYYITYISHSCDGQGNYSNSFKAIPAALKDAPPNAHVRIPKAHAQVATIKDNADPDNMGRVQVQFPWQDKNEATPWIRVVYPYAGSGDAYFVPEKEDQVMIGFEHDNPDRPFVMGSVYHGKKTPQYATDDNSIKAIHTKSGHRILFQEGDDSMISIITKDDKSSIVLSLNGDGEINVTTKGVLNLKGKTINIEGDELNIKMDSAINMEAGQDLTAKGMNLALSADQDASVSGMTAKMEGQTEVGISGAQAKVEGQATTTIKGGMVQIN